MGRVFISLFLIILMTCPIASAQQKKQVLIPDQCAESSTKPNNAPGTGYSLFGRVRVELEGNAASLFSANVGFPGKYPESFAGSYGQIVCRRREVKDGQNGLKYIYGRGFPFRSAPSAPTPPSLRQMGLNLFGRPIVKMANQSTHTFSGKPITPPDPNTIVDLGVIEQSLDLSAGDYIARKIHIPHNGHLSVYGDAPVRIFLTGQDKIEDRVFFAESNIDAGSHFMKARNLQLWYNGEGTIALGHNITYAGTIYAPRALVTMGPNNVRFVGSIVANEIKADGNVSVDFDPDLATNPLW